MYESQQKKPRIDAIIAAINLAAMGAGIAAAVAAANKSRAASADADNVKKSISELGSKFDKISEQLKAMQLPQQKIEVGSAAKESRPDGSPQQQQKPQDVIYVRKSSEFSFYN